MSSSSVAVPCTGIFWDVADFPFRHLDILHLLYDMRRAFPNMCRVGEMSAMAYFKTQNVSREFAKFISEPACRWRAISDSGDKYERSHNMLVDIVLWALEHPANYFEPSNLVVISGNIKEGTDFLRALEALEDRYYNVLLVIPEDPFFLSSKLERVSFRWLVESLSVPTMQGLNLNWNHKRKSREENVGFSNGLASLYPQCFDRSPITVFWDVQDSLTGDPSIGRALRQKGYGGEVLIRPYVDENYGHLQCKPVINCGWDGPDCHRDMHVCSPTRVVVKGNKYAKITRMLLDLLFWAINCDDIPQNFLLISKPDTKCSWVIEALEHRGFNLILGPSNDVSLQLCKSPSYGGKLINQSSKLQGRKLTEETRKHGTHPVAVFCLFEEDCLSNTALTDSDIMTTLYKKGYVDILSIRGYVDEGVFPNEWKDDYKKFTYGKFGMRVDSVPVEPGYTKIDRMAWDMISWTFNHSQTPNYLIIAEPFQDLVLDCILEDFKSRGLNVLLEMPDYMVTCGSLAWSAKSEEKPLIR
ncbi:hypothetical protein AALP_AAs62920U001300 [Arabis alpina]|uniref:NYN domain-containing protein n=1 Tax=Arabis alpina TaxID=50452 RepID=A0A087FYN3_ARAAL|nr:hypothetical protein AALP_AAs62920U001300 [Arabis alpina]